MKKTLVFLGLFVGMFTLLFSCNQAEIDPLEDETALLTDFLFFATADDSTGHPYGKKHELTAIELTAIPAAITDYITANYPGATLEKAGVTTKGFTVIKAILADGSSIGLVFDASGVFVKEHVHRGKNLIGTKVEISELPVVITDYIATTFPGATIHHARVSDDGKYGIIIDKADGSKAMLGFAADGTFIQELTFADRGKKRGKRK